jgi:hypothetical protein
MSIFFVDAGIQPDVAESNVIFFDPFQDLMKAFDVVEIGVRDTQE